MGNAMGKSRHDGHKGQEKCKEVMYKRKDDFGECGEGESGFDDDYLLPQMFIPNLPSPAS
jgi:hypothetical protein